MFEDSDYKRLRLRPRTWSAGKTFPRKVFVGSLPSLGSLFQEHRNAFALLGVEWPPSLQSMLAAYPRVDASHFRSMGQRKQEMLYHLLLQERLHGPSEGKGVEIVDLNPSWQRIRVLANSAPCMVPSGTFWVHGTEMSRLLTPEEAFGLMSWDLKAMGIEFDRSAFTYRDGLSLAGNAFEGHCALCSCLAALVCFGSDP